MIPLTLPLVEAHLAQIATLNLHHQEKATDARNHEHVMNDLIAATEVHTHTSLNIFKDLSTLYISSVALHSAGHMHPLPMTSLRALFHHHMAAEAQNAETRRAGLALRARHVAARHHHVSALAALELHHVVLLAIRAELISRRQGATNTWLQGLHLYI
jgi:hypothetical protein